MDAIKVSVAGEWFIEVAKDKGWYSNAGQNWDSVTSAVLSYLSNPVLYISFAGFAGVVGALWLDTALKVLDARRRESRRLGLLEAGSAPHPNTRYILLQRDVENGYSPISQETASSFYALQIYLHKRGHGTYIGDRFRFFSLKPHQGI